MAQLTRPKSSWELRAEAAESSLSAIRALVQQWREQARQHLDASGDEAEWAHCRMRCAKELAALCPTKEP